MVAEAQTLTWREYSTVTGRLATDLIALGSEFAVAGIPARAYVTFHEQGAQYRVTARWTVED